jgi:hypothetical protein
VCPLDELQDEKEHFDEIFNLVVEQAYERDPFKRYKDLKQSLGKGSFGEVKKVGDKKNK